MSILTSPYILGISVLFSVYLLVLLFWKRFRITLKLFYRKLIVRRLQWLLILAFTRVLKSVQQFSKTLLIFENWLEGRKKLPRTGMRDLSPTRLADKDRGYAKILKWALDNRAIKNLAVSGPYGSGKSSIIQTFQQRYPGYRYLNISLASFKNVDGIGVELILLSILQQIFYYVKSKSMPDSRYKRINPISKKTLLFRSAVLILWGLSLCFVIKPDLFKAFPEWENLLQLYPWIRYAFLTILITGGIAILYYFLKLYNSSQLSKLNIASGTLEVQPKSESSILNKHLDEILYFFEISKYDVVIIEDIDRFTKENTEVFTKLREINTLINNAQQIGRHVTFVYAVRDELFKNEDRTKFFDFIMPVIPVINSSNSGDQLSIQLKEAGLASVIDPDFINKMSDYVTDMRMLINIMNEFLIYKKTIGNFGFEHNNLLGMVIYKNIEPDDFAELQHDNGLLFNFIRDRHTYNEPLTRGLNETYISLQKEINSLEDEVVTSIEELRSVYIFAMFNRLPAGTIGQIDLGSGFMVLKELLTNENFLLLRNTRSISYQSGTSGRYATQQAPLRFAFSEVENEVGESYEPREKLILIKTENRLDEKKKELQVIQEKINKIRFAKIKELSGIKNLELINSVIADKTLLIYLLEKGYIDEHYRNYISYFYAEQMTSADRDFIMGINYNRQMDTGFKLEKVHQVVKNLSLDDFDKSQVLNISLLDFLLSDIETYKEEISRLFAQISTNSLPAKDVREKYQKEGVQKGAFMGQLTKSWPKLWEYIQLESNYSDELKEKYLLDIMNNAELNDIVHQDSNKLLSEYIADIEDFKAFSKQLTSRSQTDQILKELDVKFTKLSPDEDARLFNLILQHDLYRINPHMMNLMIAFSGNKRGRPFAEIDTAQYTLLRQFGDENILAYIHKNISTYVSDVLLKLPDNSHESQNSMLALLNNIEISVDQKMQLLSTQSQTIQALMNVEDKEVRKEIIRNDEAEPTWHNMTFYFEDAGEVDQVLADFLNIPGNYIALEEDLVEDDTDLRDEKLTSFYKQVITSQLLGDETIGHLMKSIEHTFPSLDLAGLSSDRVDLLLENSFLDPTMENYDLLKASHNGKNIKFLEYSAEDQPEWWAGISFDADDYILLFSSEVFTLEDKFVIAENMPLEVLQKKTPVADLLSRLYAGSSLPVTPELFDEIIKYASDEELKVEMLLEQGAVFSNDRFRQVLGLMGEPYSEILGEPRYARLPNLSYNRRLADSMKDRSMLSSVTGLNDNKLRLNMFYKDK